VIPARVDASAKAGLLDLIGEATGQGWSVRDACRVLELNELRYYRWAGRAGHDGSGLADKSPGGSPVHGLLPKEEAAILDLFDQWAETDRSHRKLAHRGSYTGLVWVSPSTVRRVLFLHDKRFRPLPRPSRSVRKPFPDWVEYRPRQLWVYDTTHFTRCGMNVTVVEDLVSRKWLSTHVSAEETSTQVELAFTAALEAEGLWEEAIVRGEAGRVDLSGADDTRLPILLAVSDNGPQMRSGSTREFLAMCAIAQHFGRPGVPQDQGWIESLFGHVKREQPHLLVITDAATLRHELAEVRSFYNGVRLHESIGYVTPNDQHEGRGPAIRKQRQDGLERARQARLAWHRQNRHTQPDPDPRNVG
jgi:putative transposase